MRNLVVAIIFFGIAGYAAKIFFDNFEYNNGRLQEKNYSYPSEIVIENQKGVEIHVTLLGRNSDYLEFNQKDGRKFVYPICSLSEKSQRLVLRYPSNGIEDASEYLSSGNIEISDVYVIQLEAEIRKLNTEVKRIKSKAGAASGQTELRTFERKIEELNKEIAELEDKIANRR